MPHAVIAYSFDSTNLDLIKLVDISSYDVGVTAWAWQLLYLGTEKATKATADWDLDFGDVGGLVTGPYVIKLTVTVGTETDVVTLSVNYDATEGTINTYQGIYDQVTTVLGSSYTVVTQEFMQYRDKWQAILANAFDIADDNIHNESVWPPLANTLIAYLIVRDMIYAGANRELASIESSSGGGGGIKRVETGPVNTEWFNTGSIYKEMFTSGFWEELQTSICGLASIVPVNIKNCNEDWGGHPPIILPKSGDYSYEYQYIIAPQFRNKLP